MILFLLLKKCLSKTIETNKNYDAETILLLKLKYYYIEQISSCRNAINEAIFANQVETSRCDFTF